MKLGIVGLGLIGGSVGLAAKARKSAERVVGIGHRPEDVEAARAAGAIDEGGTDLAALAGCDLVVVATPLSALEEIFRGLADVTLAPGALVTDCGSVKGMVLAAAARALPSDLDFVGSHPMAGSEKAGIAGASAILFESAVVAVTTDGAREAAVARVEGFWRGLGANPLRMSIESHDRVVAAASHLPQILASLLVRRVAGVAEEEPLVWGLCAGGFRDTTRIASSSASLWKEILSANRAEILRVLDEIAGDIGDFRKRLAASEMDSIVGILESAAEARRSIPERGRGLLPSLAILHCRLPNRPGALAEVASALGKKGINILDFALERVREGRDKAPLRLAFADEETLAAARATLAGLGYEVS